ncbi:MAG: hypothetical protein ACOX8R_10160 [Bacillota bacterium]
MRTAPQTAAAFRPSDTAKAADAASRAALFLPPAGARRRKSKNPAVMATRQ